MALPSDELARALRVYRESSEHYSAEDLEQVVLRAGGCAFWPSRLLRGEGCIVHVDTVEELNRCLTTLRSSSVVAIDVERDWFRSYHGRTCLVQVATAEEGGRVYLVDCLRLPRDDITRCLSEVFESPRILKVFHAAGNDLRWLRHDFDIKTTPILDTQVLAQKLGFPHTELTEQWARLCNVHAPKALKRRLQRSDWRRRPLAPLQAVYAAADAYALLPVCGGLLVAAEALLPEQVALGWEPQPSPPPPLQHLNLLAQGGGSRQWVPARNLAGACRPEPYLQLWRALAEAGRLAIASGLCGMEEGMGRGLGRVGALAAAGRGAGTGLGLQEPPRG